MTVVNVWCYDIVHVFVVIHFWMGVNFCGFLIVCLYICCPLEIQLLKRGRWYSWKIGHKQQSLTQEGRVVIPWTGLTLPYFCACPKPGPGFTMSYVVVLLFSELRWVVIVHVVDIGWIVDHHCLHFLIMIKSCHTHSVVVEIIQQLYVSVYSKGITGTPNFSLDKVFFLK